MWCLEATAAASDSVSSPAASVLASVSACSVLVTTLILARFNGRSCLYYYVILCHCVRRSRTSGACISREYGTSSRWESASASSMKTSWRELDKLNPSQRDQIGDSLTNIIATLILFSASIDRQNVQSLSRACVKKDVPARLPKSLKLFRCDVLLWLLSMFYEFVYLNI